MNFAKPQAGSQLASTFNISRVSKFRDQIGNLHRSGTRSLSATRPIDPRAADSRHRLRPGSRAIKERCDRKVAAASGDSLGLVAAAGGLHWHYFEIEVGGRQNF
jgi:hypothetical protein